MLTPVKWLTRRSSRKDQPPSNTELILDHDYYDRVEEEREVSGEPRWLRRLQFAGVIALLVALVLYRAGYLNEVARDWTGIAGGAAVAFMLIGDVRRGRPFLIWASDYRRSSDPVGFWVIITLYALSAGALIVGALGDLLGIWQVSL